jgi:hypothetical protein
MLATPLIRQHAPRDPQQPRQRLVRHPIKPPPRDQKHLSDDIIASRVSDATTRVREHCTRVLTVELLKPNSRHQLNYVRHTPPGLHRTAKR